MTLPDERYRAVQQARRLLEELLDPKKTPRVPNIVRQRARGALRHYPSDWDMDRAAAEIPHVFTKHLDPLYKMVKRHDMQQRLEEDVEQDLKQWALDSKGECDLEARQEYKP